MKKKLLSRILSVGVAACMLVAVGSQNLLTASAATTAELIARFERKRFIQNDKYPRKQLPYRIYVPENYDETKSYPMVLSLHGSGERGMDNEAPLKQGNILPIKLAQDANQKKYPCIIVVPQCAPEDWWVWDYTGDTTFSMEMTYDLVMSLTKEYNIDRNRMYVTGYSMGGTGTWDLLIKHPDMWAAAVPICGVTVPYVWNRAPLIKDIPIQVYHADGDTIIDVSNSRYMVEELERCDANVEYHEVKSNDHGAGWAAAYNDPKLLPWLFAQKNDNTFPPFVPPEKEDPDKNNSDKQEPDKEDPDKNNSGTQEPDKENPDKNNSDKQDPDKEDPDKNNSDKKDPDKDESGQNTDSSSEKETPSAPQEQTSSGDEESSDSTGTIVEGSTPKTGDIGVSSGLKALLALGAVTIVMTGGYTFLVCRKKKNEQ